jgi:catechol 2,3-dioxygenase-like lactoylglutathione lyase family enzyme
MAKAELRAVHPVLPSKDVRAAVEFYVQRLGFTLRGQDSPKDPRYAVIARDHVVLHLQWHDPKEWSAVERPMLRFVVPDVDALFDEYKDKGVHHARTALRDTEWGTREFAFYDRDGNGLTFYRDLEAR